MKRERPIKRFLRKIDITKPVCDHCVGDEHTPIHRYIVGVLIMSGGVGVTQIAMMFEPAIIHFTGDVVGYFIHGFGAVPFVEAVFSGHKNDDTNSEDDIPSLEELTKTKKSGKNK